MWFKSIYLKTLRDFRVPILGWGLGMGLLFLGLFSALSSIMNSAQVKGELASLASSFTWMAEPVAVDTPAGYAMWKYGLVIFLIIIWPLLVGSRILRGEEERGTLDMLLAEPRSRWRVALEKIAALWTALLGMGLLIGLLAFAGSQKGDAGFGFAEAMLFGLNITLISGVFGSIALLLAQFTRQRGTAAGWTAGLLLIFIVLDMVHRVIANTEWISRLSPIYYYNLSKPLITSYGTNGGAMLFLLGLSVLLSGVAVWLFARRDIGGTVRWFGLSARVVRTQYTLPVHDWSLRSVYTRGLGSLVGTTGWWTLGIAGFAAWMVVLTQQTEARLADLFSKAPAMKDFVTKLGGSDTMTNATLLSALFMILPLLLMAFAVTQANRWSGDQEDGRLELLLSTPRPRTLVLLGNFAALATATIFIGVLTLAATALTSAITGVQLDAGNLTAATLSMIPLGLLMAALGYLLAGWLRTAVDTGLLSFLLAIWFFISFIGPDLNWSDSVLHLSAFYYYGTPLLHGLPWWNMVGLLAASLVALALASLRFARKDIAR